MKIEITTCDDRVRFLPAIIFLQPKKRLRTVKSQPLFLKNRQGEFVPIGRLPTAIIQDRS